MSTEMQAAPAPAEVPPAAEGPSDKRWWTLAAVSGATFMLLVDVTIVQVALPTIQRHLNASFTDLEWVIDAYALSLATLLLTCGAISDHIGRKRMFIAGLASFTLASLLCGLATSSAFLIWSRAFQGLGGAAMFATGLALIGQEFQGRERGKAIAVWGATVGAAVAFGPLAGGVITQGLGWRWIFFVNVPIGVATIFVAATRMGNVRDPGAQRLDILGLVTFAGSCFLLVLALVRGNDDGWGSTFIVALFAGSALAMALFLVIEMRQQRPMFDLSLFRKSSFTGVSVGTFMIGTGMFALYPYLTLYLQNDLGYSPLQGGLRLLPSTIPCLVVPLATQRLSERLPPGPVLGFGLAVNAGGIATMLGLTAGSGWGSIVVGLLLTGIGIGIVNPAIGRIALGVVPPQRSGMASGLSNTFRIGGLATGVATLGAIFQDRLASSLAGQPHAAQLAATLDAAGVRAALKQALPPGNQGKAVAATTHTLTTAFANGMNEILLIGTCLVALGAVLATGLIRSSDFEQRH